MIGAVVLWCTLAVYRCGLIGCGTVVHTGCIQVWFDWCCGTVVHTGCIQVWFDWCCGTVVHTGCIQVRFDWCCGTVVHTGCIQVWFDWCCGTEVRTGCIQVGFDWCCGTAVRLQLYTFCIRQTGYYILNMRLNSASSLLFTVPIVYSAVGPQILQSLLYIAM